MLRIRSSCTGARHSWLFHATPSQGFLHSNFSTPIGIEAVTDVLTRYFCFPSLPSLPSHLRIQLRNVRRIDERTGIAQCNSPREERDGAGTKRFPVILDSGKWMGLCRAAAAEGQRQLLQHVTRLRRERLRCSRAIPAPNGPLIASTAPGHVSAPEALRVPYTRWSETMRDDPRPDHVDNDVDGEPGIDGGGRCAVGDRRPRTGRHSPTWESGDSGGRQD
ncbi:hypothetical protein AXG93_763s1400 [Marchantia polymorpha subsp. ruderalis]|uniref:Uncharacterized protein n=1 Tax=Marchantia polymorpha subsp. ruderalis TaxID=1480154 RepID=A0A176WS41_MARPO|nr:hypothetical protein AXG93_763s1400 [Marchantia polymorpha subsp. ruderalis]